MEAKTIEEFFCLDDLCHLEVISQQRFKLNFLEEVRKENLSLNEYVMIQCLEDKMKVVEEREKTWKKKIEQIGDSIHKVVLSLTIDHPWTNKKFTFHQHLKIPFFEGPNCFIKDQGYLKEVKTAMLEFISEEINLFKDVGSLIKKYPALKSRLRNMPEIKTRIIM